MGTYSCGTERCLQMIELNCESECVSVCVCVCVSISGTLHSFTYKDRHTRVWCEVDNHLLLFHCMFLTFILPGANQIEMPDGKIISLANMSAQERAGKAKLLLSNPGVKVYRHLVNGDMLLVNRQPTLHKPGIMAHKARILQHVKSWHLKCVKFLISKVCEICKKSKIKETTPNFSQQTRKFKGIRHTTNQS